jgi:hypothetical protein
VTAVVLAGLGAVGARAARQLVDAGEFDMVFVADRDEQRALRAVRAFGDRAELLTWEPGAALPGDVAVIASAVAEPFDGALAEAALGAGVAFTSANDDHVAIGERLALDGRAHDAGVAMAIGAGLAPGLADLLVRHAAAEFDDVDEVRVARSGWAGPASVTTLRHELRGAAIDWHDGQWRTRNRAGEEIVWFPDPIGARDCAPVEMGLRLLVAAMPRLAHASMAASEPDGRVRFHRHRRRGDEAEWGAARVEVWGWRDGTRDVVVYGVIDRTAIAAGTMLAATALALAGHLDAGLPTSGVFGLAAAQRPVVLLGELARRGVRAAVFEGAPVAD